MIESADRTQEKERLGVRHSVKEREWVHADEPHDIRGESLASQKIAREPEEVREAGQKRDERHQHATPRVGKRRSSEQPARNAGEERARRKEPEVLLPWVQQVVRAERST